MKAQPVRTPKSQEVSYRKELLQLVNLITNDVQSTIEPLLISLESEYLKDGYAQTLNDAFEVLRTLYDDIYNEAKSVASSFVDDVNDANIKRFYESTKAAIGVNLENVISKEGIEDILVATTANNVSLITSIPDEYFKKIEEIVYSGVTRGDSAKSLIDSIVELGHSTETRARLIARDQTSKLNSSLNEQRQLNLGVEEYIWRTAEDGRVRESHAEKNGKIFRWDSPPADTGHPGNDIQCRCIAQAIINI